MTQWIEKLRALSGYEWRFLILAFILQPLLTLALRIWDFKTAYAFLHRTSPTPQPLPPSSHPSIAELKSLARLVNAAANRGPVHAACLARSLALWWLLRCRGITSELRIGVAKDGGEFAAHAGVEYGGTVINDSPESIQRFAVFDGAIAPTRLKVI